MVLGFNAITAFHSQVWGLFIIKARKVRSWIFFGRTPKLCDGSTLPSLVLLSQMVWALEGVEFLSHPRGSWHGEGTLRWTSFCQILFRSVKCVSTTGRKNEKLPPWVSKFLPFGWGGWSFPQTPVSQKTGHATLAHNFAKCWLVFKFLSLSDSTVNV